MSAPPIQWRAFEHTCDARKAACRCVLPAAHDGAHYCGSACGGEWDYDTTGRCVVRAWPRGGIAGLFVELFGDPVPATESWR